MKSLLELERHDCRFPVLCIGEADGFCAEHVEGVDSYCAEHRRIAGGGRAAPRVINEGTSRTGGLVRYDRRGNGHPVLSNSDARRAGAQKGNEGRRYDLKSDHEPDLIDLFGGRS